VLRAAQSLRNSQKYTYLKYTAFISNPKKSSIANVVLIYKIGDIDFYEEYCLFIVDNNLEAAWKTGRVEMWRGNFVGQAYLLPPLSIDDHKSHFHTPLIEPDVRF
jgi:hypothetical protein